MRVPTAGRTGPRQSVDQQTWAATGHPDGTPGPRTAVALLAWVVGVLALDADGSLWLQRVLGLLTWAVLAVVLRGESVLVRVQTFVVVMLATAVEYTFSPLLGVYTYRFDNVPAYVPPGHGLVYLAALAVGRAVWVRTHLRVSAALVLVVGGTWAAYGVTLAERTDVLGAFWLCCLAGFLRWGPSRPLYVGAFVVVSILEVFGTALGTWEWQPLDPTGVVAIGNPPSGAAGGYGWFDLFAVLAAGPLLARWRACTRPAPGGAGDAVP